MSNRYYTKEHEWLEVDGDSVLIGITVFAQEKLGDIVFVDLPTVGDSYDAGDVLCGVESVKTAADVFAPLSLEVTEVNEELSDAPELLNEDAEKNWICRVTLNDPAELDDLMDEAAYKDFIAEVDE